MKDYNQIQSEQMPKEQKTKIVNININNLSKKIIMMVGYGCYEVHEFIPE
jgi:hypothetical protein